MCCTRLAENTGRKSGIGKRTGIANLTLLLHGNKQLSMTRICNFVFIRTCRRYGYLVRSIADGQSFIERSCEECAFFAGDAEKKAEGVAVRTVMFR